MELSALTGLKYLYLDDNYHLSVQQLETLSYLTSLCVLAVPCCDLTALPAALSALANLRMLFCHGNRLRSLPGASSWLGRITVLSVELATLCQCLGELRHAENLTKLYITRSGDPVEQQCTGLLDALMSLPNLKSVLYVNSAEAAGGDLVESFAFGSVLQSLGSKPGCQVKYIEEYDMDWC